MSWLTFFGYLVMLGTLLWLPEISRKLARVVIAHRPVRRGRGAVGRASLAPLPRPFDLIAYGQAARWDDRTIDRVKENLS